MFKKRKKIWIRHFNHTCRSVNVRYMSGETSLKKSVRASWMAS